MKEYKILSGVNPTEYEHPFDRQSLDRLERTRGLDLLTDKVLDHGLEKFLHIKHTGDNVRVESHNIPELHALLIKACQILDMDDLPQLYIHLEDKIQSFSSGEKRRIVVISSGAVDLLTEEELLFLIGREIGHIKSNHVVYRMMAESLQLVSQIISEMTLGIGNLLSMPLKVALMHWYRLSEFTADRAGLLVCQNPEVAGQAFLKMAGLPAKFAGRVSVDDLRKQAQDFDNIQETNFDKFIRFAASYENPQPFTVIRAAQLFDWVDQGHYEFVLNRGRKVLTKEVGNNCPRCMSPYEVGDKFCTQCGFNLTTLAES